MNLFAEGVESTRLACNLVLLIPAFGVLLLGRRRAVLVAVWTAVVAAVSWIRFVGWWPADVAGAWHILTGIGLVVAVVAAWKQDRAETDVLATGLAAIVASWTWIPCVGRELGDLLNAARDESWSQLLPTVVYTAGHSLPFVLVAALAAAFPEAAARMDRPWLRGIGLGLLALVGTLVAATLFDDLAGELAKRSSF